MQKGRPVWPSLLRCRPRTLPDVAHRLLRLLVTAVLAIAGALLAVSPASAHAELLSSDPADGAVLDAPPPAVTLTFSEALMAPTVAVAVSDADRNVLDLQTPAVDGSVVTVPWPAAASAGAFTVAYRVVSQDGHPIEGAVRLTIEGDDAASTPSPAATPSPATPAPTTDAATTPAEVTTTDGHLVPAIGMAVVVVLVAAFAFIVVKKRKQP